MILDGKRIAFLGDSITCGACLDNEENSYVNRIARSFCWKEVLCEAVPGSRIGEYIGPDPRMIGPSFLKRYSKMKTKMDIVVVFGGTNDFGIGNAPLGEWADETPMTFYGALNILLKGMTGQYPEAFLLFLTPLHRRTEEIPNEYSGAVLSEYVEAIRLKTAEYGMHLLDLFAAKSLQPGPHYYRELILEDGIHPNEKGHEVIAKEIIQYLEKKR